MNEALLLRLPMNSVLIRSTRFPRFYQLMIAFVASLGLALSAKMAVILQPIPVTLQTFAVLFIAMVCGWRVGVAAVTLYLLEGAIGLPVFAASNPSAAAFFGPTAGYLFGFLPAAMVTGLLIAKGWGHNRLTTGLAGVIGMLTIYLFGILWLAKFMSFSTAFDIGMKPFLLADAMKVVALAVFVPLFWQPKSNRNELS